MCQNDFMSKSTDEAWAILEDFAEKDQQWKSIHVPSHERIRGVYAINPNLFPIEDPQAEGGTPLVYPSEQANSLGYNNAYNSQYQPN